MGSNNDMFEHAIEFKEHFVIQNRSCNFVIRKIMHLQLILMALQQNDISNSVHKFCRL